MKSKRLKSKYISYVLVGLLLLPILSSNDFDVYAQLGNTISGHVFGAQRQPVSDVNVELLDDLQRTVGRTRTNPSGRYIFNGLRSGRFIIRVMPYGTDYEEQEQEVELSNFSIGTGGNNRPSGFSNEQRDFYLRPRRGSSMDATGTIFAQEVPDEAKKLYQKAISDLNNKKEKEAFEALKAALEIFPKYYAALERLGVEYVRLGHFDAARILLSLAVEVNPRGYKSWYWLAYSQYSLKNFTDSTASIAKAVELNGNSAEAMFLSGILMRQNKRFQEAEKQLLKAKDLSNDRIPQVHWQLALLYGNDLKRYGDAANELRLFLKAQPDTKDAENIKKLITEFEGRARSKSD